MKIYPNWKSGFVVFGGLIVLFLVNFFWQVERITATFKEHSMEHSKILGAVVELNIRNSLMSIAGMETIIASYLKNSAGFINYLDQFDSFTAHELAAFANESGLAGVNIYRAENDVFVEGPKEWSPRDFTGEMNALTFLPQNHLYIYTFSSFPGQPSFRDDYITVGMSSEEAERIGKEISTENLLNMLNQMEGIEYVRFANYEENSENSFSTGTALVYINGKPISETRIEIGDKELIVGLEANYFAKRIQRLRKEMIVFVSFLVGFGCFSSWWLYRIQRHRLKQTREFERKMARQLEQASLGRATATITHEIRNPLNAISMGLQRLQFEAGSLADDHLALVVSMREAVERSNSIVSNLQQYVGSFVPDFKYINVAGLIENIAVLYKSQCFEKKIDLELQLDDVTGVSADEKLLTQALENLFKNAVEAQISGGFIKISLSEKNGECRICFENQCESLEPETEKMIFEPYFTTKTYGSGLGLSISRKIIEAHFGQLKTAFLNKKFSVFLTIPVAQEAENRGCHNENTDC